MLIIAIVKILKYLSINLDHFCYDSLNTASHVSLALTQHYERSRVGGLNQERSPLGAYRTASTEAVLVVVGLVPLHLEKIVE